MAKPPDDPLLTLSDAPTVMGLPRIPSRGADTQRPPPTRVQTPDADADITTAPSAVRNAQPRRPASIDHAPSSSVRVEPPTRPLSPVRSPPPAVRPKTPAQRRGPLRTASAGRGAARPAPRRSELRFILGVVLILGLALAGLGVWVGTARSSGGSGVSVATAKARAFRDTAFVHFGAGRMREAITALEQGHKARPHPAFVLDIALVQAAAGQCSDALRTLARFGEACGSCPTRSVARAEIDGVHTRCSVEVMIDSTPMGATIQVDGKPEGTTPVMLHVLPGEHDVKLELDGYAPLDLEKVPMEQGQRRNFTFELKKVGG